MSTLIIKAESITDNKAQSPEPCVLVQGLLLINQCDISFTFLSLGFSKICSVKLCNFMFKMKKLWGTFKSMKTMAIMLAAQQITPSNASKKRTGRKKLTIIENLLCCRHCV